MTIKILEAFCSAIMIENHNDFEIAYAPDFRQKIAESCPHSIDDTHARADWGWKESYDLAKMTRDVLVNLRETATA